MFKNDPNIRYAFQFYEPLVFTLQGVPWDDRFAGIDRPIPFPFELDDLDRYFPPDDPQRAYNGRRIDEAFIEDNFAGLKAWADQNNAGVYLSEFAAYKAADDASTERYIRAIREACDRNGFGWAVWDYNGEFAVRRNRSPTAVWKGLFTSAPDR